MKEECFLCGKKGVPLERHHLIGGTANRRLSEKYGLIVYLCAGCHRTGDHAAHRDPETAKLLHQYAEKMWLWQEHATVDDFIRVFGKNYLEDEYEDCDCRSACDLFGFDDMGG